MDNRHGTFTTPTGCPPPATVLRNFLHAISVMGKSERERLGHSREQQQLALIQVMDDSDLKQIMQYVCRSQPTLLQAMIKVLQPDTKSFLWLNHDAQYFYLANKAAQLVAKAARFLCESDGGIRKTVFLAAAVGGLYMGKDVRETFYWYMEMRHQKYAIAEAYQDDVGLYTLQPCGCWTHPLDNFFPHNGVLFCADTRDDSARETDATQVNFYWSCCGCLFGDKNCMATIPSSQDRIKRLDIPDAVKTAIILAPHCHRHDHDHRRFDNEQGKPVSKVAPEEEQRAAAFFDEIDRLSASAKIEPEPDDEPTPKSTEGFFVIDDLEDVFASTLSEPAIATKKPGLLLTSDNLERVANIDPISQLVHFFPRMKSLDVFTSTVPRHASLAMSLGGTTQTAPNFKIQLACHLATGNHMPNMHHKCMATLYWAHAIAFEHFLGRVKKFPKTASLWESLASDAAAISGNLPMTGADMLSTIVHMNPTDFKQQDLHKDHSI